MRDRLRRLSSDSDRIELDRNLGASVQDPKKAGRSGVTQPCYLSDVAKFDQNYCQNVGKM